jgi:hypothetical protein
MTHSGALRVGPPGADLRVTRPRILSARRTDLRTFTVGDEAVIEFGPGLLRFLSLREDGGPPVGEGGAFEWTIPVGAAGTAAYAVVEPVGFDGVNLWTGVSNVVRWGRACAPDETLVATCRLAELGRFARLPYRTFSRTRGDVVVTGEFVFVSVASDAEGHYTIDPRRTPDAPVSPRAARAVAKGARLRRPAPPGDEDRVAPPDAPGWEGLDVWSDTAPALVQAPEPVAPDLFALRRPRVLRRYDDEQGRETWEWLFPRDLLRLLGHPVGGAAEPLGRRHHPYGRILEGMAVHAAQVIDAGAVPGELAIEWWSPTRGAEDFRIRSSVTGRADASVATVHDIYEGERAVGTVRVTTRRRG